MIALKRPRLKVNPILVKELRSRMRDARAFLVLTGMLLLLGGGSYLLYRMTLATASYSGTPLSPQIGQSLFYALAFLELMVIAAIAPAVTAGAISSEQEKLTYEMLMATPLKPGSILWGKLISALGYVFLLIFAAIPMASLIFIFGGVTMRDMVKALVILFTVAIMLGMVGMFMSSWLGRTARATVASYLVVVALMAGPVVAYIATGVLKQAEPPRWLLIPNPLSALFSALTPANFGYTPGFSFLWSLGSVLGGDMRILTGATISMDSIPRPIYHYSLPFYALLTLVLYLLASRLVRPTQRWKMKWREVLGGVGLILVLLGLTTGAFLATAGRYENSGLFAQPAALPAFAEPAVIERVLVQGNGMMSAEAYPVPGDSEEANTAPGDPGNAYPAPENASTPTPFPPSQLALEELAKIYAAVIHQLYAVDHTFGDQPPDMPVVYLVWKTDDRAGDPGAEQSQSRDLTPEEREQILAALENLAVSTGEPAPGEFRWVESMDEVQKNAKSGEIEGGGVVITLGNIHPQKDGSVQVAGSIYFGSLAAGGQTYILQKVDGAWHVIGNTGVQWIS